jgi:hypothetical protein
MPTAIDKDYADRPLPPLCTVIPPGPHRVAVLQMRVLFNFGLKHPDDCPEADKIVFQPLLHPNNRRYWGDAVAETCEETDPDSSVCAIVADLCAYAHDAREALEHALPHRVN